MHRTFRIAMTLAALGITGTCHAHDNPIAHTHGAPGSIVVMMLVIGAGALMLVALKRLGAAHRKRARQAIPVVMIAPGLRRLRDR